MIRSTCGKCGADVVFVRTRNTLDGRSLECNAAPSAIFAGAGAEQVITFEGDLVRGTSAAVDVRAPIVPGWRPHWQTCGSLADFRANNWGVDFEGVQF